MTTIDAGPIAAAWTPRPTVAQQLAEGRAARDVLPRESLSATPTGARDPMAILDAQDVSRVTELVPIRTERMGASAFAFFRGTAAIMAADLARTPDSGILVASCGDAHVANFGLYASPQRTLAFDLNDFDEAAWAPWEWDVKRLITSVVLAGQEVGRDERVIRDAALAAVRTYARALRYGAQRTPVERYFDHYDATAAARAEDRSTKRAIRAAVKDAERRTGERAQRKLTTHTDDGRMVFVETPPTMTRVGDDVQTRVLDVLQEYRLSTKIDIRMLLRGYALADLARRVVGVGSVGTRCYLIAMQDGDGHGLILQAKEAGTSVLVQYGRVPQPPEFDHYVAEHGDGGRVVGMQRILQAVSDPFLGHVFGTPAEGGPDRSFYVRQFHDKKGGFDVDALDDASFRWYAEACGATLARAHGQSPNAAELSGYVGGGRVAGEAILEWAWMYARQATEDWKLFRRHRGVDE